MKFKELVMSWISLGSSYRGWQMESCGHFINLNLNFACNISWQTLIIHGVMVKGPRFIWLPPQGLLLLFLIISNNICFKKIIIWWKLLSINLPVAVIFLFWKKHVKYWTSKIICNVPVLLDQEIKLIIPHALNSYKHIIFSTVCVRIRVYSVIY